MAGAACLWAARGLAVKALRARLLGLGLLVCGPRDKLLWCGASLFAPILVVGQQLQEEFCMSVAWGRFGVPMGAL